MHNATEGETDLINFGYKKPWLPNRSLVTDQAEISDAAYLLTSIRPATRENPGQNGCDLIRKALGTMRGKNVQWKGRVMPR